MICPGKQPRLNQGLRRHHRTQVEGFEGPMEWNMLFGLKARRWDHSEVIHRRQKERKKK